MNNKYLLALDCGTQSVRALVFDLRGNLLDRARIPVQPYFCPAPGRAEQNAEYLWQSLCQACQGIWDQGRTKPEQIQGIALTCQRASLVPLDEEGTPLRPLVSWLDQRLARDLPQLPRNKHMLLRLSQLIPTVRHFQARALDNWLAENEPHIWSRTQKYLLLSGYLHFMLCGEYKDSTACQVGYLPFDYPRQNWLPRKHWKWHLFRVRPWQLPRLLPPGHILGNIQPQASQETGLPQGLPIVAAAADKACEVLGAGCIHNQQACLGLGTTATINVCSNRYKTPKPLLPAYPAAVPGMYNLEIQNFRGFWLVSWFKHQFGHQEMQQAEHRNMSPEEILNLMLDQTQPGSLGLMVQPFWTPGLRSPGPEAKGSILGFGDVHSRAHVYRALLEGLAYALLQGKLDIEKRLGQDIETLVAAGGGARSDQVLQLLADVFGQEVHRPHTFEASGLGAAINLARGLGFYPDFSSAIQSMTRTEPGFIPNKRNHRLYKALFSRVYQKLYPRLRHLYQELREITGYPE